MSYEKGEQSESDNTSDLHSCNLEKNNEEIHPVTNYALRDSFIHRSRIHVFTLLQQMNKVTVYWKQNDQSNKKKLILYSKYNEEGKEKSIDCICEVKKGKCERRN